MKRLLVLLILVLAVLVYSQVNLQATESSLLPIMLNTSCGENVSIYVLDVGQGDSILVKTASKNVLIDGGPTDGGNTLMSDLSTYKVAKIDLMVVTHPHTDHIGGLISVLKSSIPVQDIVYNGYNYTSIQTFNTWKALALTHNLTEGSRGQVYAISPTINFTIVSPTNPTQFGSSTNDINDNSIVMRLQVGNTSALFTGDAQIDSEQSILSAGLNLHSQILKVGHHGSNTSTSQAFLTAVSPTYAAISAGINNTYGHPAQQTLNILSSNNVETYGTYDYGTIIFSLNAATSNPTTTPTTNPTLSPAPTISSSPIPNSTPSTSPTETQAPITNSPIPTPTPVATLPISDSTQRPFPSATPTVAELSVLAIMVALIGVLAVAIVIRIRSRNSR